MRFLTSLQIALQEDECLARVVKNAQRGGVTCRSAGRFPECHSSTSLDLSSSASPHHTLSLHVIVLAASIGFTLVGMIVLFKPFVSALKKILLSYCVLLLALHLDIL
jgi:hypothetical protein